MVSSAFSGLAIRDESCMNQTMENREIEVRFLGIDKGDLVRRLRAAGAQESPEYLLEETIFYDPDLTWRDVEKRFVRIRKQGEAIAMTYKHRQSDALLGTEEIEFAVSDMERATLFVERLGLVAYRKQAKKRHSFTLDGATIDIDTWPTVPPYAELEGNSEDHLKSTAAKLGLDWGSHTTDDALIVLEKHYKIPFGSLRHFTFDRIA